MNSVVLSIKTDPDTKAELQSFAKELGVSSTALVNMVIKQTLRDRSVKLEAPLTPTPYLQKLMKEAEEDYTKGDFVTLNSQEDIDNFFDSL
jgi:antitoxin component of RelBE/YafQ-DinJ toxin-antitoxin module